LNPGLDEAPARLLKSSTIFLTEDPEDGLFVVVAARAVFDPEIGTLDLTQLVRDRVHSEADLQDPVIENPGQTNLMRLGTVSMTSNCMVKLSTLRSSFPSFFT